MKKSYTTKFHKGSPSKQQRIVYSIHFLAPDGTRLCNWSREQHYALRDARQATGADRDTWDTDKQSAEKIAQYLGDRGHKVRLDSNAAVSIF